MRIFALFISLAIALFANQIYAKYDVKFGLFGKIGVAEANLSIKNGKYTIKVYAKSQEIAAAFSQNRFEVYESEGLYIAGEFIPLIYRTLVQSDDKYDKSIYEFYHEAKKILRYRERKKEGEDKQINEETLPYYAKDDLLTLFFNLPNRINLSKKGETKELFAVGGEKKSGKIEVSVANEKKIAWFKEKLGDAQTYLSVKINQPIFISKTGELFLALDQNNLCKKGMLEGVILFGNIYGELVELESKGN